MEFTFTFKYVERDVIPPRCRKPRDIWGNQGEISVFVKEVDAADFPLAIVMTHDDPKFAVTRWHWHDARLWLPVGTHAQYGSYDRAGQALTVSEWLETRPAPGFPNYYTLEANQELAREWAARPRSVFHSTW